MTNRAAIISICVATSALRGCLDDQSASLVVMFSAALVHTSVSAASQQNH